MGIGTVSGCFEFIAYCFGDFAPATRRCEEGMLLEVKQVKTVDSCTRNGGKRRLFNDIPLVNIKPNQIGLQK